MGSEPTTETGRIPNTATSAVEELLWWIERVERVDDPAGNTIYAELRDNFLPRIQREARATTEALFRKYAAHLSSQCTWDPCVCGLTDALESFAGRLALASQRSDGLGWSEHAEERQAPGLAATPASSRFLDLDAPETVERLALAQVQVGPFDQLQHYAFARAFLAALREPHVTIRVLKEDRREPGDTP